MYCRNVYLRTGLTMPAQGWVVDLGANRTSRPVALEVHPDHGDVTALVNRLRRHGFAIDLRDNDGVRVTDASGRPEYAYCRR